MIEFQPDRSPAKTDKNYLPAGCSWFSPSPYRMTEGNSCWDGGKPGVSNTLASALWCADMIPRDIVAARTEN